MQQKDDSLRDVIDYYSAYDEQSRLSEHLGQVELVRTQRILRRYLPSPPAVVLDVGGAAGRYACWLARKGYAVHLVDPVPLHVQQAEAASDAQPAAPIASCTVGDARQLDFEDEAADVVLMLGPLYHLVDVDDRRRALAEAYRVLKPGGHLFAAGISRFASTIDGLTSGFFTDPAFQQIMRRDLEDGQHRNPTDNPAYFMDTFFHHPDELRAEVAAAGFEVADLLAVEGISYLMRDFETHWENAAHRAFLLEIIDEIEREPTLLGASPHLLCVGVKA
jgi:ubiquinone/menaquinone biosynthesis C-methylase UbiE